MLQGHIAVVERRNLPGDLVQQGDVRRGGSWQRGDPVSQQAVIAPAVCCRLPKRASALPFAQIQGRDGLLQVGQHIAAA